MPVVWYNGVFLIICFYVVLVKVNGGKLSWLSEVSLAVLEKTSILNATMVDWAAGLNPVSICREFALFQSVFPLEIHYKQNNYTGITLKGAVET